MDPISQGVVGAVWAASLAPKHKLKPTLVAGALASMAADLDVFISSGTDPLLFLEYHRQFTHSLVFAPVGALIIALCLWPILKRQLKPLELVFACFLGYLSHGLLDACTTYGTQLFWPFSNERVAWHLISIIDPIFTLPLLVVIAFSARAKQAAVWPKIGLFWIFAYLAVGETQRQRAEAVGFETAEERGHTPTRLEAKPGFGQLLLWKTVYEYEGYFFVDGVRTGLKTKVYPGANIKKIDQRWANEHLPPKSQILADFTRFQWFSNDYLALDPNQPNTIIDVRYSMNVNEIAPLWSIQYKPDLPLNHVDYLTHRNLEPATTERFLKMLWGH
jgi:inner membrane protein